MSRWGRAFSALLFAIATVTCADPFEEADKQPSNTDQDEDGYSKDVDCDDEDRDINPGMEELENCKDDNCDGKIDEDTPNFDADDDTYCPSTGDSGDCEGNAARNPGMAEDGGDGSGKNNNIDDNCNGIVDEGMADSDIDGDGFTLADGDCNDNDSAINPGAIEVVGRSCRVNEDCPNEKCYDGFCRCLATDDCSSLDACLNDDQCENGEKCDGTVCRGTWLCLDAPEGMPFPDLKVCGDKTDNDCDGTIDEYPAGCDDPAKLDKASPFDYAKAMDICDTDHECGIEKDCPGDLACVKGKCRRVLAASFNSDADARSRTIGSTLGTATSELMMPRANKAYAVLSSGLAEYDPHSGPDQCPQSGTTFGNTGVDPDPDATDSEANDTSELKLEILVPTNARSFSFDFHFLTTEYPEYLDTEFNDTFWVHLDSKKFKGNISFDKFGTPIRLNNAFFDICDPDPMRPKTSQFCTRPSIDLAGTGYYNECAFGVAAGGSTGWLTTVAPVEPGERITLTFTIFDKGDHILDSTVLIDNFRWKLTPAAKPITGPQ